MGERGFFLDTRDQGLLKNPASECQAQCQALRDTWPGDGPDTKRGVEGRWLPVFAKPSTLWWSCVGKVTQLEEVRRAHCTRSIYIPVVQY